MMEGEGDSLRQQAAQAFCVCGWSTVASVIASVHFIFLTLLS